RDALQAQPDARRAHLRAGPARHRSFVRHGDDGGDPVAREISRRLVQPEALDPRGVPRVRRDSGPARKRVLRTGGARRRRAAAARPRRGAGRRVPPRGARSGVRRRRRGGAGPAQGVRPRIALRLVLILAALAPACASRSSPSGSRPIQEIPPSPGWTEQGIASWYGGRDGFEGKPTASGEIYDSSLLTAAHRELPLGSVVDVTNLDNGKTVRVRINDRGPFVFGRVIDLSRAAAREIGLIGPGVGSVRLTVVTPGAPMEIVS